MTKAEILTRAVAIHLQLCLSLRNLNNCHELGNVTIKTSGIINEELCAIKLSVGPMRRPKDGVQFQKFLSDPFPLKHLVVITIRLAVNGMIVRNGNTNAVK